jgi:GntR family transcriptional regulator/MocR family aminotransferase
MAVGAVLERLLRDAWRDLSDGTPAPDPAGDPLLRATIAAHVRATRGGRCEADDVVVLSGAVIGIAAVARLHVTDAGTIAVEDPPDPSFRRALELATTRLAPVAADANGLRIDRLPASASVVLASPRVQAVTGARMPLARRLGLLAWAGDTGAVVLEDARADDLALGGSAGPSLQALDDDGRVIHLGGFAALLHPGVQIGYAVVPPALAPGFLAAVAALDPGATPVQQRALGRFLADGHLDRHLGRVRRAVAERLDSTVTALRRDLGWLVSTEPPAGGTRLVITIEDDALTATRAVAAAARAGIGVEALSRLRMRPTGADRELLIDVGRAEPQLLVEAVGHLAKALADERRHVRDAVTTRPRTHAPTPIPRRWPAVTRAAERRDAGPVRVAATRAARDA